uniref:Putative ixostatin n=1 Tax=Ixodes ricinus TaxID=34613 RepID=A0A0K8RAU2_IXORI
MQFVLFTAVLILQALQIVISDSPKVSMDGYVDKSKSQMAPICRAALEDQLKARCRPPGFYEGVGEVTNFDGCSFKCVLTRGNTEISQQVNLADGIPCGPNGEVCRHGKCVGGGTSRITCRVTFVPKSVYE